LDDYRADLWGQFLFGLVLTSETAISSLLCLGIAQSFSASDLFTLSHQNNGSLLAAYSNSNFRIISGLTALNIEFALAAILIMIFHNTMIFKRENQYSALAKNLLEEKADAYSFPDSLKPKRDEIEKNDLEKIHNIERLLNRVLKNHESAGESYAAENRSSRLLGEVLQQKLTQGFRVKDNISESDIPPEMIWDGMKREKQRKRWLCCCEQALIDYQYIGIEEDTRKKDVSEPYKYGLIEVYNDLICYRDSKLVLMSGREKEIQTRTGSHLRCSVKKRTMTFLLWGENFSNMDLSGICFSGADLHFANFSDSDLTRVRLLGANCKGADFSRARLSGLYFGDMNDLCQGQIPISCIDDNKEEWDPYDSREATILQAATFSGADVSRAFLAANGGSWDESFPFAYSSNREKLHSPLYSLNDTCFDYAKLFSSRFRDLNFDQASLERAQIFDSVFFRCSACSSNFSRAIMTHSLLFCCDFHGANLEGAVLAKAVLLRTRFESARLKNATFAGANIAYCNFQGAYCQNVSFRGVIQDLKGIEGLPAVRAPFMIGCTEVSPQFAVGLDFSLSVLSNTDFTKMDLSKAKFDKAVGADCIFTGARGERVSMDGALLTSSILNQSVFRNSSFRGTVLKNSIFMEAVFIDCEFVYADFSDVLFQRSDKAVFYKGKMKKVSFHGAEGLSAECFREIILEDCDFSGTGLRRCDFGKDVSLINCRFLNRLQCKAHN